MTLIEADTASFVDDVVKILKTKSYVPRAPTNLNGTGPQSATNQQKQREDSQVGPISSIVGTSNSEYAPHALHAPHATSSAPFHAPKGPAATRPAKAQHRLPDRPTAPSPAHPNTASGNAQQSSRKRKLVQRDTSETRDSKDAHYNRTGAGQRPIKQTARRDGKNSLRGGAVAFEPQNSFPPAFAPMPNMLHLANLPPPPPGPMPFDMNDPMAFFTMMAALGTNMAGMPPLPSNNSPGNGANGRVRQGRCHDYHEKGFCARGDMCAFQHGGTNSAFNDAPEYDPDQPSLSAAFAESAHKRAGPYNSGKRGRRTRAPFSMPGPLYDRTNTTLVVEQIPEEHFSEDDVRGFFSDFGTITEVEMQAHKRLAIVKFEDHAAANQAYMSPKAVFENRFVKVYWYKKDMGGALEAPYGDVDMADDENDYEDSGQVLDPEEIARRQAEAQKAFEERRRKIEEAEAKSADIDRQLQEKDAEMRKIRQQLAELAGDDISGLDEEYSEDLATLQAEAENLFAQKEPIPSAGRGRGYPPRGGYRGRVYTPFFRERGAPRGAYRGRGRGAFAAPFPGSRSSVKRLDNRPRRLAIAGIEKGSPRDEALRQYLVVSHTASRILLVRANRLFRTCQSAPASSHILKTLTHSSSPLSSGTKLRQ